MAEWNDSCLICGERFSRPEHMSLHVRREHFGGGGRSCDDERKHEVVAPCQCPFCPFEALHVDAIDKHLREDHASEMKTPQKTKRSVPVPGISNRIDVDTSHENGTVVQETSEMLSICPICGLTGLQSTAKLQKHVNNHFDAEGFETNMRGTSHQDELLAMRLQKSEDFKNYKRSKELAENLDFKDLQSKYGMENSDKKFSYSHEIFRNLRTKVGKSISPSEFYSKKIEILEKLENGIDDGLSVDRPAFFHLKTHLQETLSGNEKAFLCSPVEFIGRGDGDGGWGCGYRNIQMLVSSLKSNSKFAAVTNKEFKGNIPSIPKIQESIEKAWSDGYDKPGCLQLDSKLQNTKKWIGATEAFTYFAHLNFRCRIVDFNLSNSRPQHDLILQWLMEYFEIANESVDSSVTVTTKLPLYFQHDGHSRTIVGIVVCKKASSVNVKKIAIFDPGNPPTSLRKKGKLVNAASGPCSADLCAERLLKPVSDLSKKQYQIVAVVGNASNDRAARQKDVDAICEKVTHRR